jgi:hypothetical protein
VNLDVSYTCMLQAYVSMVRKCFLGVFASVSYTCFKCSICLFLYVATVASEYLKSRSGVAHRMHVGSGWRHRRRSGRHERRPEQRGPTTGALAREPVAPNARSSLCEQRPDASNFAGFQKSAKCPVHSFGLRSSRAALGPVWFSVVKV